MPLINTTISFILSAEAISNLSYRAISPMTDSGNLPRASKTGICPDAVPVLIRAAVPNPKASRLLLHQD